MINQIMKEMVAGCCVCSDETGWAENPLVYCDGPGCNIAVHQACYGIVEVPNGNWYCDKCKSGERRVRCELCPSRDGALKRTDKDGWAHVVCGLYIPEVRFFSVVTMEPIVLSQIPTERYNKVCYICEQNNRGGKASMGACMQCNKPNCKNQFHVTCAQQQGLLCEEAGNYSDNVKYCGYCQDHYTKLKKGAHLKIIPPYKPVQETNGESSSEESPETNDGQLGNKRTSSDTSKLLSEENSQSNAGTNSSSNSSKFTTSNFVESVITSNESVFTDPAHNNKKRKLSNVAENGNEDSTLKFVEEPNLTIMNNEHGGSVSLPASTYVTSFASTAASMLPLSNSFSDTTGTEYINQLQKHSSSRTTLSAVASKRGGVKSTPASEFVNGPLPPEPLIIPCSPNLIYPERSNSVISSASIKSESTDSLAPSHSVSQQDVKESPVTSPENSIKIEDKSEKQFKMFNAAVRAPHMLGNELNPNSSMAQKMTDSLKEEMETHRMFVSASTSNSTSSFVGPPLRNKITSAANNSSRRSTSPPSSNPFGNLTSSAGFPQTLEELLETQWEQGGTFLMEQAQHFDIASLLTCLHKLREENHELEEHIQKLKSRRDYLLAANARLATPLPPTSQPPSSAPPPNLLTQHSPIVAPAQTMTQVPYQPPAYTPHPAPRPAYNAFPPPPLSSSSPYHSSNLPSPLTAPTDTLQSMSHPMASYTAATSAATGPLRGPPGGAGGHNDPSYHHGNYAISGASHLTASTTVPTAYQMPPHNSEFNRQYNTSGKFGAVRPSNLSVNDPRNRRPIY